jgi:hypothetical protein
LREELSVVKTALFALLCLFAVVLAGCGGGSKKGDTDTQATGAAKAACEGSALASPSKLPPNFPQVQNATYTKEGTEGPTDIVEGYFSGSVKDGHAAYTKALNTGGYAVTHDELDEHDSEVNWKGHGRSGQVALREQCGESDKIYVRVTNRPA